MRAFARLFLTTSALVLMTSGAWAQGFAGGGGGGFVIMAPNVQKELKFTDEQSGKVRDTVMELGGKYRDQFMALRDLPESERPAKVRELSKALTDDVKKALSLSDEQAKRYDQIVLQQRGLQAFIDPDFQTKLRFTDEQKQKASELSTEARQKSEDIRKDAGDNREELMRKFIELRKEYADKAIALLSDDQKKTWRELTGEPFEVKYERPNQ